MKYNWGMADIQKPYVLGITGNIASGKSVVRQYLENAGALTIDADLLAQETYLPGNRAYQPILDTFGTDLCLSDGQINRGRLGRIVFRDPRALETLEGIIYPFLGGQLEKNIRECKLPLVVIEAVNLFESDTSLLCDRVWAVIADDEVRKERLMDTRGLEEADALQRIAAQPSQQEKINRADYVIHTDVSHQSTYDQTATGLLGLGLDLTQTVLAGEGFEYRTLLPADFAQAAEILSRQSEECYQAEDFYRLLGTHTILAAVNDLELTHFAFWKMDHHLAILESVWPSACGDVARTGLVNAVEHFAWLHGCQVFVVPEAYMKPAEAKSAGFLPGSEEIPGIHPLALNNFLRKHGLMPGEVFQRPLQ